MNAQAMLIAVVSTIIVSGGATAQSLKPIERPASVDCVLSATPCEGITDVKLEDVDGKKEITFVVGAEFCKKNKCSTEAEKSISMMTSTKKILNVCGPAYIYCICEHQVGAGTVCFPW